MPGVCTGCGAADQACCNTFPACQGGQGTQGCILSPTGSTCSGSCGLMGLPCCGAGAAGECQAGLGCGGRGMGNPGTCSTCGGPGQPCCVSNRALQAIDAR